MRKNRRPGHTIRARIVLCCMLLISAQLLSGCLGKQLAQQKRENKALTAPAAPAAPTGPFGGEWWDFYKRGLALVEVSEDRDAMADFREAMAKRDQDQWQAPIDTGRAVDYFPHRELGIRLLASKEYDKAIAELEKSMASAPSAKADLFLNKARAGKIMRDSIDRTPPEIAFQGSTAQETTNSCSNKVVTGVASDDTLLVALTVAGRPIAMPLPEKQKVFTTQVDLHEGTNTIKAVATDLTGKTTEKNLEIFCDRWGPQVEIEELTPAGGQVTVSGNVSDDRGLRTLTVNGEPWPITGKAAGYNFKFSLPEGRITIVATDLAGNVTGALVRQNERDLSEDDSPPLPAANTVPAKDNESPVIMLDEPSSGQETTADTVRLSGQISDSSLLVYISINGEQIPNRRGKRIYFSQTRSLREGNNTIRIIAADAQGNKSRQIITVTRTGELVRQLAARQRLALLPFSGDTAAIGPENSLPDRLRQLFVDQARFNLVEQEQITNACQEMRPNSDDPLPPEETAQVGKRVGAATVLTGRVMAGRDGVEIVGQFLDSETATLLARNDVFGQDTSPGAVDGLLAGLTTAFTRDFPLVEGVVREVRATEVLLDLNSKKQIRPLTRLLCYRQGPPAFHPVTGEPLPTEEKIVGELLVTAVDKDAVRATVLEQKGQLLGGDRVIAR